VPVTEENGSEKPADVPKKKSRRRSRGRRKKPLEPKQENALPDSMQPVMTAPEIEVTQNSDTSGNIPLMLSIPLYAESTGQDQPAQKAPLLIQPAEHEEVEPLPAEPNPAENVLEEGKNENL